MTSLAKSTHSALLLLGALACSPSDQGSSDNLPPLLTGNVVALAGSSDTSTAEIPIGEFSDIRGLAFDTGGRIIVADNSLNQVRVFDNYGNHLYSFGQQGAGPADFEGPCCIAATPENHLLVLDFGNRRYSEFALGDTMARHVATVRMPSGPTGRMDRVTRDASGAIWHYTLVPGDQDRLGMIRSLLDSSASNRIVDTLWPPPPDSLGAVVVQVDGPEGAVGSSTFFAPYGTTFLRAVGLPGGYARAVSSKYQVTLRSDSGAVTATLRREIPRAELSPRERERAGKLVQSVVGRHPSLDGKLKVPDIKPPLSALGVDLDGRLWVVLSRSADSTHLADVYTAEGDFIERREWPRDISLSLFAATGSEALGVQRDSLGIERVVRMTFEESN